MWTYRLRVTVYMFMQGKIFILIRQLVFRSEMSALQTLADIKGITSISMYLVWYFTSEKVRTQQSMMTVHSYSKPIVSAEFAFIGWHRI